MASSPRTFVVDFETYYDTSKANAYHLRQKGMSYPEFILDPRFKVHGMAVDDGERQHWIEPKRIPAALQRMSKDILVAHNGYFDFGIMAWHYKFIPTFMVDTLALANNVLGSARDAGGGGNGLAALAERLGLEAKGNELETVNGIRDPDEAQLAVLAVYAKKDVRIGRQILNILLPQVTNQDFELWLLDHTLRTYITKQLQVNPEKITAVAKLVETRRAERVEASGVTTAVLSSNKQFAEELEKRLKEVKLRLPSKKSPRTGKIAPALSKQDAAFLALAESSHAPVSNLVRARLVQRSALNAAARLATMQKYHKLGLGIPVHLVYYGAHTGRFSGGGGFNFQNLTSPDRATDPVDREIAQAIREAIEAGEGHVFVPVDAAQIEARVLPWLAGEDSIIEAFATGADIYSEFISGVLGEKIYKPTGSESPEVSKHLTLMRFVGKESVLGLGYGMGVDKFAVQLKNKSRDVAKLFDAGKLTKEFVGEVVKAYRDRYTKITALWGRLEKAFHSARMGATRRVGPLKFVRVGRNAVGIVLPSGRTLYYRNIRSEKYTGKPRFTGFKGQQVQAQALRLEWKHGSGQKIYGGLLAENVTQAVARDILAEAILAAEQQGYPVALHIHDEVVCRVPESQGKACHDFLIAALSNPPAWGSGLVLSAEGKIKKGLGK